MGYYKDTGSLRSMASAEAILKKRMPEKVGILPVAELLFVAESMWVGEHDMKGHFHPSFRFVKAKRYNAKPHVLIELDGETLADINGRSKGSRVTKWQFDTQGYRQRWHGRRLSLGVPRRKKEVSTDDHHQADGRAE